MLVLGAITGGALLGVAPVASAAPCGTGPQCVHLSFNWAVLNTPSTPNQVVVSPAGPAITAVANTQAPVAGVSNFSVDPADWSFPTYNFNIGGITGTINVSLKNPGATGTVNFVTGAVQMTADLLTRVTPTGGATCTVDSGSLTLSTASTQPLAGHPFPPGALGVASGAGAFGVSWQSLPNGTPASACTLVDAAVGGPGGLWISRNISPVPPALALSVNKLKTAKAGRTAVVKAKITNSATPYGNPTGPLTVCLTAPKPLKPKSSCKSVASLTEGQSAPVSFKVKTHKHRHGKYKLTLTVTGTNLSATKTITLKVRK